MSDAARRDRRVATWLLVVCGLVFAMVVLGGVTRLTGSGLSITEWKPVTGLLPPLSAEHWQSLYEQYRQTPEFRELNAHMSVEDFKGIFWLEYLHRLLGRVIGLAFIVPFIVFAASGCIRRRDWPKYLGLFALGGLQGLLGWYMVKSGLVDVPHVSQYRLTAHLVLAFAIFAFLLWTALGLLDRQSGGGRHPWFGRTAALVALIVLTIVSGGFVAGLEAGRIYNTFPTMGGHWLPPGLFAMEPAWRNFFENMTTVQFDHRVLALSTAALVAVYWIASQNAGLPARAGRSATILFGAAMLQVALGIATVVNRVPIVLGALHQATAMILFTAALVLLHALGRSGRYGAQTSLSQP